MRTRGEILRAHYLGLLRKAGTWAGLVAVFASMFVALPVNAAAELTSRSATLSNSVAGATNDNFALKFTFATSGQTVGGFGIQICDSPLSSVGCANTGTSNGENFSTATSPSVTLNSGTWANSGTCTSFGTTHTGNLAMINCTVGAITGTPTVTINLSNVTNPSAAGQWYIRVSTYTANNDGGTNTDFGAMAVDTANQMSESATVQESLNFVVGSSASGSTCGTVSGTGAITMSNASPVTTSTPATGTGVMCANTNAPSGYIITYAGTSMTAAGGSTFPNVTQFSSVPGTANFGFNEKANTTPAIGANVQGAGTATCTSYANYCTTDKYSYSNAGGVTIADSGGGVTADNVFTLSFVMNIDNTIKFGTYSATQTFIATGTF